MTNVFKIQIFSKITLFIANIGNFYPTIQKPAFPLATSCVPQVGNPWSKVYCTYRRIKYIKYVKKLAIRHTVKTKLETNYNLKNHQLYGLVIFFIKLSTKEK